MDCGSMISGSAKQVARSLAASPSPKRLEGTGAASSSGLKIPGSVYSVQDSEPRLFPAYNVFASLPLLFARSRMSKSRSPESSGNNRRNFLKISSAAVLGSAALPKIASAQAAAAANSPSAKMTSNRATAMPTRNLGKTGYKVGIFSLGGQAALEKPSNEAAAVPIIE